MKDVIVTLHRGFSAVAGETGLIRVMEETCNGKYAATINRIVELVREGQKKEAEKLKKTLPYLSLTANYSQERLPYSIVRYNHVTTIDIDGLQEEQIENIRKILEADTHVLAFFLSPKQHGFKIFIFLHTAYANKLRDVAFFAETLSYIE